MSNERPTAAVFALILRILKQADLQKRCTVAGPSDGGLYARRQAILGQDQVMRRQSDIDATTVSFLPRLTFAVEGFGRF